MSDNLTTNARGGNFCLQAGGWATGSTATNIRQVTATMAYVVGGRFFSRSGDAAAGINVQASAPSVTADGTGEPFRAFNPVQPAGTVCLYGIGVNSTGGLIAVKGDEVRIGSGLRPPVPPIPRTHAPTAYVRVATATNPFTFGVTAFNASGVTTNYFDVFSELADPPGAAA